MNAAEQLRTDLLANQRAQTLKTIGEIIDRGSEDAIQRFNHSLLANLNTHGLLQSGFALPDGRYFAAFADPASLAVPAIH